MPANTEILHSRYFNPSYCFSLPIKRTKKRKKICLINTAHLWSLGMHPGVFIACEWNKIRTITEILQFYSAIFFYLLWQVLRLYDVILQYIAECLNARFRFGKNEIIRFQFSLILWMSSTKHHLWLDFHFHF